MRTGQEIWKKEDSGHPGAERLSGRLRIGRSAGPGKGDLMSILTVRRGRTRSIAAPPRARQKESKLPLSASGAGAWDTSCPAEGVFGASMIDSYAGWVPTAAHRDEVSTDSRPRVVTRRQHAAALIAESFRTGGFKS